MESIVLLILDECHNADKEHPMSEIMRLYKNLFDGYTENEQKEKLPRVLGLTATIIRGKPKNKNFRDEISSIESRLCAKCITYHKYEEVLKYSTTAHDNIKIEVYRNEPNNLWNDEDLLKPLIDAHDSLVKIEKFFPRIDDQKIDNKLFTNERQRISNKKKFLTSESINILKELIEVYNDLGPYPAKLGGLIRRFYILGKGIISCDQNSDEYFLTIADTAISNFITRIDVLVSTKPEHERIEVFISNKVKLLLSRLSEFRNEELCGLVFTSKRVTSQILNWFFKEAAKMCGDKYSFIKPGFVIGASRDTRDPAEIRITTKNQSKIIYGFHRGDYNIIFATSVLEEGLNVPICNVVIRFDEISTYPSYVQSMGRARKAGACFIVLIDAKKPNENLDKYKEYNELLSNHLVQHAIHLDNDNEDDELSNEEFETTENTKYDFRLGPDIPRITLNSAIKIVNSYCTTLRISNVSTPSPLAFWEQNDKTKKFRVHVQLPLNSVIRDYVHGDWMENKVLAKKVAYIRVCEILFKEGVLDERLMPRKKPMPIHIEEFFKASRALDVKENNNWVPKKMPDVFKIPFIITQNNTYDYAYKIHIKLTDSRFEDSEIAQFYDFEEKKYAFSVLSHFPINIDSFELNARYGDLTVKFERISIMEESKSKMNVSEQERDVLQIFHDFIFAKLLKIEHPVFEKISRPNFLLAPICEVNGGYEVYWKLAEDISYYSTLTDEPKEEDRRNWKFDKDTYNDVLVATWYKKSPEPEIYVVLKVIDNKNALSDFEDEYFKNFAMFFKIKYNVETFHTDYNLLKCKKIGKVLNFLSLKHVSDLSKVERREIKNEKSIARLIPELTNLFPMPGSIYIQAFFLPSILQRMTRLLLSQEIQKAVANEFDWVSAQENGNKRKLVESDMVNKKPKLSFQDTETESNMFGNENSKTDLRIFPEEARKLLSPEIDITNIEHIQDPDLLTLDQLKLCIEKKIKKNQDNLEMMEMDIDFYKESASPDQEDIVEKFCPNNDDDDYENELQDLDHQPDFKRESGPDIFAIQEAITLMNAHDSINMEKLETLGDSYLKYSVSVNLFVYHSNWEEGVMSEGRSLIISNNNLYKLGKAKYLDQIIAGSYFNPEKTWLPPLTEVNHRYSELVTKADINYDVFRNYTNEQLESASREELENDLSTFSKDGVKSNSPGNVTYTHARLKSKNVADCAEALIGAYYKNGGAHSALRFMKWLGIQIPKAKEGGSIYLTHPLDFPKEFVQDNAKRNTTMTPEDYLPFLKELEATIKYSFSNKWLAVEAFTYPGLIGTERNTRSYQRLEYLGDAALDFLITQHIFDFEACKTPGDLTDLRSALVNNVTYASLAVRYGFHKHILISDQKLHDTIDLFQNNQKGNNHKVTDGHFTMMNDIETVVVKEIEVPKCLGDVFESLAGAVLVDCGFSLNVLWRVFYRLMRNEIVTFSSNIPKSPVRMIYENFANVKFRRFEPDENKNPNLSYVEMVVNGQKFIGCGDNKRSAKQAVCKYAIKKILEQRQKKQSC